MYCESDDGNEIEMCINFTLIFYVGKDLMLEKLIIIN